MFADLTFSYQTKPRVIYQLRVKILTYRISSNNSRWRLFLFSNQNGAIIRGKEIIRGGRLFLTGGRAIKSNPNDIKFVSLITVISVRCQYLRRYSLNHSWLLLLYHPDLPQRISLIREREKGEMGAGDYLREAINRGTAIIRGHTAFSVVSLTRWPRPSFNNPFRAQFYLLLISPCDLGICNSQTAGENKIIIIIIVLLK